jgi:hypothetical protein
MKRRLAAGLTVIALAFVGVAAAGTVNLGGTGATTNCGGGGFIAINTQVGSGNPTIVPSGDWKLRTWSVAGGSGGIVGLRILRPTGVAYQYKIVASTGTKTLAPGVLNTFTASIVVHGGDVIGLYVQTSTDCARSTGDPNDQFALFDPSSAVDGVVDAFDGGAGFQINLAAVLDSGSAQIPYAGYCSAPGNTWPDGTAIVPGTFLYLIYQQPATDSHYTGATPAIYVKGKGITCDPPPAGYTQQGYAGNDLSVPDGLYPYYAPSS